ncbi:MAG: heme exporter protein CcmB [Dehalococcoidia bacterium]|nr:heme exporter protein CcmB [Dehalococcoidia bacterium]MDW8120157.1 heme exporter protein CcmB [Chloroflexota bacterium]
MEALGRALWGLVWKDLLIEVRSRELVLPLLVFVIALVVMFTFSFEPRPALVPLVAPGVLWAAITFLGTLGFVRLFSVEREQGGLEGLLTCPVPRSLLYTGKVLASVLFLVGVEALVLPVFSALFNLPFVLPLLWAATFLCTIGFSAVGVVFSAMVAHTRAREVLLPVLFFPIVLPVIIAGIAITSAIITGEGEGVGRWLGLVVAFDIVYLIVGGALFDFVLGE